MLDASTTSEPHYGLALLQAFVALLVVGALCFVVLKQLAKRGFGLVPARGKALSIEERLPLDLKSALVIVQVEGRRLLIATGEHGPPRLLAELEQAHNPPDPGAT